MPNLRKQTLRLGSLDRGLEAKGCTQNQAEMCDMRACGGVGMKSKVQSKYITAFDPILNRRCVYVVKGDLAISLVTGHKFNYKVEEEVDKECHK